MKQHLRSSFIDTMIGMLINIPLNYFAISVAFYYNWTAEVTTVVYTIVFTFFAITRKTLTNAYFYRKQT